MSTLSGAILSFEVVGASWILLSETTGIDGIESILLMILRWDITVLLTKGEKSASVVS
jgi:hypothetical protein